MLDADPASGEPTVPAAPCSRPQHVGVARSALAVGAGQVPPTDVAARDLAAQERRLRTEEREAAKVLLETAQAQLAAQKSMAEGQRVAKADAQGQADDARAQAEAAAAVVKESRAAMMELEAARVSMREQLLVARAESEEQKAQLAGLLRTGGLYGYGH